MNTVATLPDRLPTTWEDLNALHPLRPIHHDAELMAAEAVAEKLALLSEHEGDQGDYYETLAILIEQYEEHDDPHS